MKDDERAAVAHVRRTLEEALSARTSSSVLFEALGAHPHAIPQEIQGLTALVRGPLAAALRKRVGAEQADAIVQTIEEGLRGENRGTDRRRPPDESGRMAVASLADAQRDDEPTQTVPTFRKPVRVAVLAAGGRFAERLRAALGSTRVDPCVVRTLNELREPAPSVVVIDASEFLPLDPVTILEALESLPSTTAKVLWGRELPYGRSVDATFERARRPLIALTRPDGIDPLLDVIRSRHKSGGRV